MVAYNGEEVRRERESRPVFVATQFIHHEIPPLPVLTHRCPAGHI